MVHPGETAEGWKGECRACVNDFMEYWDYVRCNMLCNNICNLKHVPFQVTEGISLLRRKKEKKSSGKKKSLENKHFSWGKKNPKPHSFFHLKNSQMKSRQSWKQPCNVIDATPGADCKCSLPHCSFKAVMVNKP